MAKIATLLAAARSPHHRIGQQYRAQLLPEVMMIHYHCLLKTGITAACAPPSTARILPRADLKTLRGSVFRAVVHKAKGRWTRDAVHHTFVWKSGRD